MLFFKKPYLEFPKYQKKKNQNIHFALFIALAKNECVMRMFWKGGLMN